MLECPTYIQVTFIDAKTACESSGKRLCTIDEWQAACFGPNHNLYSFSNSSGSVEQNCYAGRTQFASDTSSMPRRTGEGQDCTTEGIGDTENKVYDMIGNVAEWTESGNVPVAAGGTFYFPAASTTCDIQTTDANDQPISPLTQSNDVGFRCCKSN